jgi:hypothetical protein
MSRPVNIDDLATVLFNTTKAEANKNATRPTGDRSPDPVEEWKLLRRALKTMPDHVLIALSAHHQLIPTMRSEG